ncbi:DNA polymerase III subunit delta' [bacterium]|nr:DNA polymerase III subunit delta' [bacterium]
MKKISVYGQEKVKNLLISAFKNDKLAHAYLFLGRDGTGKEAAAIAFALMVNCENNEFGGCGKCRACTSILNHESPDFTFIQPTPKKNQSMKDVVYRDIVRERLLLKLSNPYHSVRFTPELTTLPIISVDQIRDLKKGAFLKVAGNGMRVFIISNADKMNANASNSLLKLLEEPPPRTILILTSFDESALLETVVSRCQIVRFLPLADSEVCDAVKKETGVDEKDAGLLAAMAEGSVTRGIELAGSAFDSMRTEALDFFNMSIKGQQEYLGLKESERSIFKDKEYVRDILGFLIIYLRDMMFIKLNFPERVINRDRMQSLIEIVNQFPEFKIEDGIDHLYQAIDYIGKNAYLPLIIYSLSSHLFLCTK